MSANVKKTDILSVMKKDLVNHRGAYARLALYLIITLLTGLIGGLSGLTEVKVMAMHWWDWSVFVFSPVLSSLMVWRSFLDNSLSASVVNVEDEKSTAKPKTPKPNV